MSLSLFHHQHHGLSSSCGHHHSRCGCNNFHNSHSHRNHSHSHFPVHLSRGIHFDQFCHDFSSHSSHFNGFRNGHFGCGNHSFHRSICDRNFLVRLGGLQNGMAFRLRQLVDCKVKLGIEFEGEEQEVKARICFVGTDFIEVRMLKNQKKVTRGKKKVVRKQKFLIIPFDRIRWVTILDY
jgi:hypothetical protein